VVSEKQYSSLEKPKIKAEDNPWYLLATLYGVPEPGDEERQTKNRLAWNRYFSAHLDDKTRERLIEKRHPAEELTPFSPEGLQEITTAFAERCKASGKNLALPPSGAAINFGDVKFVEKFLSFDGYLFSRDAFFQNATLSGVGGFSGATFSRWATFGDADFYNGAFFDGTAFSGRVSFDGTTFSGSARFRNATFSAEA
jgi:hypothetical protein